MAINYEYLNKKKADQAQARTTKTVNTYSNKFAGSLDPNTSEGLYNLAMANGGRQAEVIKQLAHPEKNLLSSIGNKLKKFGGAVIDVLETPNEIVAGIILSGQNEKGLTENVKNAIKKDLSTSDVLFGDFNSTGKSGLQKVGNFALRTGVDILLDPLSYLTFGASRGIMGFSAAAKITAGEKLAAKLSTKAGKTVGLAEGAGDDLLSFLDMSMKKGNPDEIVKIRKRLNNAGIGDDVLEGVVKEESDKLTKLLDMDVVNFDVGRKAISNILEVSPGLAETIIDKGGIKYFGATILEGQKIRAIATAIPGMSHLDKITKSTRMAIGSLFNPNIKGTTREGFKRIPEEIRVFEKQLKRVRKAKGDEFVNQLVDGMKGLGYKSYDEMNTAIGNAYRGDFPSDKKLAAVYKLAYGLDSNNFLAMNNAGANASWLSGRFPKLVSKTKVKENLNSLPHGLMTQTVNASKMKKNVMFESISKPGTAARFGDEDVAKAISATDAIKKGVDEKLVRQSLDEQVSILNKELDKIERLGLDDTGDLTETIVKQKKAIESGKLDNIFIDEKTGEVLLRRSASIDEMLKMPGFEMDFKDINWLESFSQASTATINQTTSKMFMNDLGRFGVTMDKAPQGYETLNIKNALTDVDGNDLLFSPDVKESFEVLINSINKPVQDKGAFLEAYDSMLSIWKSSVTSMFPSFHARNGLSNVMLNFADIGYHAFNPATHVTAGTLIQKNNQFNKLTTALNKARVSSPEEFTKLTGEMSELIDKHFFTDGRGHKWTFGEMHTTLKSRDLAFTDVASAIPFDEELRRGKSVLEGIPKSKKDLALKRGKKALPFMRDFYGYEVGRTVGTTIETQGRLVNFLSNLQKTGDVNLAASRTKQFLFDYSDLTDFEKNVMRRIIPFYSFTKFNLQTQAKVLVTTPGKSTAQLTAMDNFSKVFSSDDLTDEQKEAMPSWMKRGFYYMKKQKDGTLKSISVTDSPLLQPLDAFSSKGILGSISPLIRLPIEQMTGYDMYQGKVFADATNASGYKFAPKFVKDFIGYDDITFTDAKGKKQEWSVSLRPSRLNLINNLPPTSRVFGAMRQLSDANITKRQKAIEFLFGANYSDVDIEKILRYEEKATSKEYSDVLNAAGSIWSYKKNIVSKEE